MKTQTALEKYGKSLHEANEDPNKLKKHGKKYCIQSNMNILVRNNTIFKEWERVSYGRKSRIVGEEK
jgi:hypothetical protein